MVLSHILHAKASVERIGGGVLPGNDQRKSCGPVHDRPVGRRVQKVPSNALPSLVRADLQRVQHCFLSMARGEGDPGRAVTCAGKDCGLRAKHTLHHRNPGGADAALLPKRAGDGEGRPMRSPTPQP